MRCVSATAAVFVASALFLGSPRFADASNITDVASSFDPGNAFDFRFRIRYDHLEKRALIKREMEGLSPQQDTLAIFKDLAYEQHRDTVALRMELGLYHDLMLHFELPIILEEAAGYSFDQSAGGACVFPPQPSPNCVNMSNSTTVADGIVPGGGFDATHAGSTLLGGSQLFRSVLRGARGGSGLDAFDTFNFGITWAPISQARDDTKPTWTVSLESQISFGNVKAFDRDPRLIDANHGVSEGVHRLFFKTAVSKRFRYFDPYLGLWYMLPIARGDSLFRDYGPSQKTKDPQMQAGTTFGTEIVPYERADKQYKVALDLGGRIEGHFAGRAYSEIWELLAGSPALRCDATTPGYNPACTSTATMNGYQNQPFTGITAVENYATLGADVALQAQLGPLVRFRTGVEYTHDQSHFITGDDIGTPVNTSGRVRDPGEFNPAYRPVIDLVGRRYLVSDVDVFNFYLWAQVMF